MFYESGKLLCAVARKFSDDTRALSSEASNARNKRQPEQLLGLFGITTYRKYAVGPGQLRTCRRTEPPLPQTRRTTVGRVFRDPRLPHTHQAPTTSNAA